jgi:DNA-binding NtrC family response regulator
MSRASVRILVVDDDEGIRRSFSMVLRNAGYVVDTAEDGKEAIEKSRTSFYNLALIDIRLPDMEGVALLTAMKETTPKMVKILVTGYPSLDNAVEAVNRGADGYLIKPADMTQVLKTVEEHLVRQGNARRYSEGKVLEFVESRVKELEAREADPNA